MLPANLISALQALSNSGKPSVNPPLDALKPVARLEPGQQFQAIVQSKTGEGMFKVQIAGQIIQMHLPGNIQSGDTIRLEVIATQPRITFRMAASVNPISTPEQIGATARILSNLAELPEEMLIVRQSGSKAIWQAGQMDARQLAVALRDALGRSGLFYESHQAQWIRGERSMSGLLEEPQNLLAGHSASGDKPVAADAGDVLLPIAKELLPLVQQQLHTLEHHHLAWQGQVWPGQEMLWEIQGQPEHQAPQQEERQWSTEMELALPRLGEVHARLVFSKKGLQLTLHAADTATVAMFDGSMPLLKNSLADAGIALNSAVVEKS